MEKIQISFSEPQLAFLRAEASRKGISVPALVRNMVDNYGKEGIPEWFKSFVEGLTVKASAYKATDYDDGSVGALR